MRWDRCILVGWLVHIGAVCAYKQVSEDTIRALGNRFPPEDYLDPYDEKGYLEPILKVRVPGTENSTDVQNHISGFFKQFEHWNVTLDSFTSDTPITTNTTFTNIIATRDPPGKEKGSAGRLVLAAHYDSKIEPEGFIGAIDSAVPCAILMYVVKTIDEALTKHWSNSRNANFGIQIIFFDGEEAFKDWTDTDSIYGARHLASRMENDHYSSTAVRKSSLDAIDTLVLLDLIGSKGTPFPSYFMETDWLHQNLRSIEKRLRGGQLSKLTSGDRKIFPNHQMFYSGIGDDHLPFLYRGVPILHLIGFPFPEVWHKISDDADHLDADTIHDWALIMSTFVAEYFELGGQMPTEAAVHRQYL